MTTGGAVPAIAAVVPAYNAAAMLPACIGAIKASRLPVREIILFDDGSTDGTGAVAASLGARVLRNDGRPFGPGEGRNRAAAASDCPVIVFIDADVVVDPDAIGRLAAAFDAPQVTAAFGSYDDHPASRRLSSQYANLRHHYVHQQGAGKASTFWSGLGMVRRDAFFAAGGFELAGVGTASLEDIELGHRMIDAGGEIRLVPDAQATHLKDWKLFQLWRSDIMCRAIPWSRLIGSGRAAGGDLNGAGRERIAAVLAYLVLFGLAGALLHPVGLAVAALAALAYVWLNRSFFGFLARRMGALRVPGAIVLHWLYHLYASAIFAVVVGAMKISGRSGSAPRATGPRPAS